MPSLTRTNGLFTALPGTKLLGEIITWSCAKLRIQHIDLIEALRASGLDESVARELAPRHAFARACKKLSEARIIRQVAEDEKAIKRAAPAGPVSGTPMLVLSCDELMPSVRRTGRR